jgi:hypothetical protein
MKYILLMNTMQAGTQGLDWSEQALGDHIAYMIALNKDLSAAGQLVDAQGLTFPDQAKIVRAGADGRPITDGVFPETKEFLAGYWLIEVERPEQAYEIAARASAAPGPDGEPLRMPIEVRPLMDGPSAEA